MKKYMIVLLVVVSLVFVSAAFAQESPSIPSPSLPDFPEEIPVLLPHTVTVNYIDVCGSTAAPSVSISAAAGAAIAIDVPENCTPVKSSLPTTMPNANRTYTMICMPQGGTDICRTYEEPVTSLNFNLVTIDDYDTPLGLGSIQMNIGICVE